jgi:hypothetical protein
MSWVPARTIWAWSARPVRLMPPAPSEVANATQLLLAAS